MVNTYGIAASGIRVWSLGFRAQVLNQDVAEVQTRVPPRRMEA